jgi:hypothetical protein
MRKQVTLLSGLALLAGTAFGQQNVPAMKAKSSKIAVSNGIENKKNEGVLKAGGDLIWSDDFSGTNPWTVGTSGQGTFILGDNTHPQITASAANGGLTPYMGTMASTTVANGFAFFNGVQYLVLGTAAAQNTWVASEVIDFTGIQSINVSFQQRYRAFNEDVTYVEFSGDGGTTWTVSEVVNAALPTNGASAQNTVTVVMPVGGAANGMIRFRWESAGDNSGYGWCIDDVSITEGYDNNVTLLHTFSGVGAQVLQYSKFPLGQTATAGNISFGAKYKNVGNSPQPAELRVTSGAYDFTGAAVTPSTPAFAVDSVEIVVASGKPMPTTAGAADFTFEITSSATLDVTGDDSQTVPFEVTPFVYAVDSYTGSAASMDGSFEGWQGGTGNPAIGTLYEIFEDAEIGSIDIGIGEVDDEQPYIGREFVGLIYILNSNGDFEYYDETEPRALVASDFGTLVKLKLPTTISVAPGLFLVMASSYSGSPVPFAFSGFAPAGTTLGLNADAVTRLQSDAATPDIVEAPVVRLDFQSYVGVNELENVAGINAAPNPFTNATEISFDLKADAEVSIVVTDLAGRVVMTIPTANYNAGAQKVSIDGASLNAGVYNYTLTVGNNVVTKRIVKK